ncbi:MFS transporter [Colletotrichum tofieldiae]|nr:MFS transporter [Colletotrichum tofieldiae]
MPILAVQVVLGKVDVPTGLNIFTDALLRLLGRVEGIDGAAVVAAGAGEFRKIVSPELLDAVVDAFNSALTNVFWVALATPALAWVVSWAMEWRQISNTKSPTTAAPAEEVSEK